MSKSDVEKAILNANRNRLVRKYRRNLIRRETLKSIIENEAELLETFKDVRRKYQINGPRKQTNVDYYMMRIKPSIYRLIKKS